MYNYVLILQQHMALCGERKYGVKWINYVYKKICYIMQNFKERNYIKVKIGNHLSFESKVTKGLRQGDAVVPLLFSTVLETAIRSSEVGTIFDK
jgi:hypothetical protein